MSPPRHIDRSEIADRDAKALRLHEVEGLSLAEIAERFGVKRGSVYIMVKRARERRSRNVSCETQGEQQGVKHGPE